MWKRKVIISFFLLVVSIATILFLSYMTVSRLAFVGDSILYGKRLSDFASELRRELIKQKDLQPVAIKTSDNITLQGFLVARKKARANVLLCHGYRGSKEFMYGYMNLLPECNILMFDFRAHGQSEGRVISIGYHEYKDVLAAAAFLRTIDTTIPLIIIGISMGGAATLKAAFFKKDIADALVIDSTFSDLKTMMLQSYSLKVGLPYYPFFPVLKEMFHYFTKSDVNTMNTMEYVQQIPLPILFIHSCNDSFIRPEHSLRLYSVAVNPQTKLWIGPRCRHGWLHIYQPVRYRARVANFLRYAINFNLGALQQQDAEVS